MWDYIRRKLSIDTMQFEIARLRIEVDELRAAMFDETHPLRQTASTVIGERHIARLKAEEKARKHTAGEL